MSAWWIGAVIGACLGVARVARGPVLAQGVGPLDPADWRGAAHASFPLLRLWLVLGPVCFVAAFLLLEGVGPATDGVRRAAAALGLLPAAGLASTISVALLRVGDARRRADDVTAQAVGWGLIVAGGLLAGTVATGVLRSVS